jgi:hypothetical protein
LRITSYPTGIKKQYGIALLVLVIVLALTLSTYYFSTISIVDVQVENLEKSRASLISAKNALIAYALNYPETAAGLLNTSQGPGNLPCPDDDLDGDSDTPGSILPGCNSTGPGTIGRFPWSTVLSEELRDGSGELLWYAVSSNFANFANRDINSSTTGGITVRNVDGSILFDGTSNDGVVAIIIAPGKTLKRDDGLVQSRATVAERDDPKNYLDIAFGEDNADFTNSSVNGFISGIVKNAASETIVNDLVVIITYNEIMDLVNTRVAEAFGVLLKEYHLACDAYPEASVFDPTKATFDSAGNAPPAGSELRSGHVPLGNALPVDWGDNCIVGGVTTASPIPPDWMMAEGWAGTSLYSFAYQNAPPANGLTCGNGVNPPCFTVNNTTPLITDAQALIIFAGRDTTGNRPSNLMADYFEGENNDSDGIYDAAEADDFLKVISP